MLREQTCELGVAPFPYRPGSHPQSLGHLTLWFLDYFIILRFGTDSWDHFLSFLLSCAHHVLGSIPHFQIILKNTELLASMFRSYMLLWSGAAPIFTSQCYIFFDIHHSHQRIVELLFECWWIKRIWMLVFPQDFLEEWTVCFKNKGVSLELLSFLTGQGHIHLVLAIPKF